MTFNKGDKVKFKSVEEAREGIGAPRHVDYLGTLTVERSNGGYTYINNEKRHGGLAVLTKRLQLLHKNEPKPKPKFKKGDKVRVTNSDGDRERVHGMVGTIEKDPQSSWALCHFPALGKGTIRSLTGHGRDNACWNVHLTALELAKPVYKVGDKVRVIKVGPQWEGLLDAVCVVMVNDGSNFRPLMLDTTGWRHNHAWLELDEVEPAGDVKPYVPDPVANPFKVGDEVRYKDLDGQWQYRTIKKLGTTFGGSEGSAVTFTNDKWLGVGQMDLELASPLKAGDLVIYDGKFKYDYPAKLLVVRGDYVEADFKLDGPGADGYIHKDYPLSSYRRPTKAELEHKRFDKFRDKASTVSATVTQSKELPMQKYIVILMDRYGNLRPGNNPFKHPTRAAAAAEAVRLAESTKVEAGSTFVVFEAVTKAVPPVPAKAQIVAL